LLAPDAGKKHLELAYLIEAGVPELLVGDDNRVRQILFNLIGNALKFTHAGSVLVTARLQPREADGPRVEIAVSDTGIGIPAARIGRLFQPFSQIDASTTREFGGTGLGLAICQRLVELMHGAIVMQSTEGEGSICRFTLPVHTPKPGAPTPAGSPALPPFTDLRVLAVVNHTTSRTILEALLEAWAMRVTLCDSAEQALARLSAERPDLVLVEGGPDSGKLARALRAHQDGHGLPRLLLRAIGDNTPAPDFEASLSKPLKPAQLHQAIASLISGQHAKPVDREATRLDADFARRHPHRILLAEDNPLNRRVAQLMLERLGYRDVLYAANGRETVEMTLKHRPDVILMDVQMPELDGNAATARIRAEPSGGPRPWIIALTADVLASDRDSALIAGMDDYLMKPLHADALCASLARVHLRQFPSS
ncbi:MAG: response regulator, partial [Verrucomicrobiota bacterium]